MSDTATKIIDQAAGFMLVGIAAALFVTPVVVMLSAPLAAAL